MVIPKLAKDQTQKSLLYDPEVIENMIKSILSIDVDEETPLSIRQAQVQLLKSITFLIE